jgi:hypothetical protein
MRATRSYPRPTEPDIPALADAIRAHMATAATGSFYVSWTGQSVVIEAANLANVNDATVQAAVDAAPAPSNKISVKRWVDEMPIPEKAMLLTILDGVNTIRGKLVPPLNAITPAQFLSAIKTKADEIVVDRPEKPKEKDKA